MSNRYQQAAVWQVRAEEFPCGGPMTQQLEFLLRYAVLAPSSHNSQPWRFAVYYDRIDVYLDDSRWLSVADADRRELHLSVGCAIENLLVAAEHFGFSTSLHYFPYPANRALVAVVSFDSDESAAQRRAPSLFSAIPHRHTNHRPFDGRRIPPTDLAKLAACVFEDDMLVNFTTDSAAKQTIDELVVCGDERQFANPAYRRELADWIGRGAFGGSWLVAKLGQLIVSRVNVAGPQARKDSTALRSSPAVGILASRHDNRVAQVQAGQVFERISLLATELGIRLQPMSQIVEISELRDDLADLLPDRALTPQHIFRLGYAAAEPTHTPRRPVAEVLVP